MVVTRKAVELALANDDALVAFMDRLIARMRLTSEDQLDALETVSSLMYSIGYDEAMRGEKDSTLEQSSVYHHAFLTDEQVAAAIERDVRTQRFIDSLQAVMGIAQRSSGVILKDVLK